MKHTSLDAWYNIVKPTLRKRQSQVLRYLLKRKLTIQEVALKMKLPDHIISGRFSELERLGLIVDTDKTKKSIYSNTKCIIWTSVNKAADLSNEVVKLSVDLGYKFIANYPDSYASEMGKSLKLKVIKELIKKKKDDR